MAVLVILTGAALALLLTYPLGLRDAGIGRAAVRLFGLNSERGVPAAFSFILLLASAAALWLATRIAVDEPSVARYRVRWLTLAVALVAVGFDEVFEIHEEVSLYLRDAFGLTGILKYAWVVPYGLAALLLAAAVFPAVRRLPPRARLLMLAGGACYVVGAVGMEMVGSVLESVDAPDALYEAEVVAEEGLEIAGIWLFLSGVLEVLRGRSAGVAVA